MQYMLLIYEDERVWEALPEAQRDALLGEYVQLTAELTASGQFRGGDPLQPVHTATTVRVRDGKLTRSDGPFAETREQLGGYYLIDARDLDEAAQIAARLPSARLGSIEIRPVMAFPEPDER